MFAPVARRRPCTYPLGTEVGDIAALFVSRGARIEGEVGRQVGGRHTGARVQSAVALQHIPTPRMPPFTSPDSWLPLIPSIRS